jgi:dTDP-4-dehydrorhamnose reductase
MLGAELQSLLNSSSIAYVASDAEVDITDPEALKTFGRMHRDKKIAWIVNCSGYTAVDRAEDEPDLAFRINAEGVLNIARTAAALNAEVVHISTDYVFNGNSSSPYTEQDMPAPLGVYGRSKLEGERQLQGAMPRHYILRAAWLYSARGVNFVRTMLRLFRERELVKVVSDQRGSPTYAKDLAGAILHIIRNDKSQYGIYNYTNEGETSWYDFARAIFDQAIRFGLVEKPVRIDSIPTSEYPTKAERPRYSYLSKDKIKQVFGIAIRTWQEALSECIGALREET